MDVVTTASGRLAAAVAGAGPSLVLLHSLLADRSSFAPALPRLSRRFRTIALDLPGFGESEAVPGDLDALSDHVAEAIRLLAPGERPLLVGNGFGSFLALAAAIRSPDLASGLFLAGCGAAFSEPGREAFRTMARRSAEAGLAAIADVAMRRLFPADQAARQPAAVAERRERFLATNPAVLRQACGILASLDLRDAVGGLDAPLLAAAGEWDEATPPDMARELARLAPRGRFVLIRDCAHVPPLQAPDAFCELAESLLPLPGLVQPWLGFEAV